MLQVPTTTSSTNCLAVRESFKACAPSKADADEMTMEDPKPGHPYPKRWITGGPNAGLYRICEAFAEVLCE